MNFANYQAALAAALSSIRDSAQAYLPSLVSALALLVAGWGLARVLRWLTISVARRFDTLAQNANVEGTLRRIGVRRTLSDVAGGFVFWIIFLFFIAAATEALGLGVLTTWLSGVAYFLPSVVTAGLVLLAGLLVANLARDAILAASGTADFPYGALLGQIVRATVIGVTVLIAVNELGIDVTILTVTLAVILAVTLGGAALAFGFGARTAVSNIIGSHYLRQLIRVGQRIRVGSVAGTVLEISPTTVVVATADGRAIVPAKTFNETSWVVEEATESGAGGDG